MNAYPHNSYSGASQVQAPVRDDSPVKRAPELEVSLRVIAIGREAMTGTKTQHSCGDSRLSCVSCSQQVCPTCLIACPVGNRCTTCAEAKGKDSIRSREAPAQSRIKKVVVCGLFGVLMGWMIAQVTFSLIGFVFAVAFFAAGRQTGSDLRRGSTEIAYACMAPFVVGMIVGATVRWFQIGDSVVFIALAMEMAVMGFGFLLGKCGFG